MARKRAIAKRRKRTVAKAKPKTRTRTRTIVKYKPRSRRRKSVSGIKRNMKSLGNTLIAPTIGTTAVGITRHLFPKLKKFIDETWLLKSLGYEASMGILMVLIGSLAPRYKRDLYNGAIGPLCIAVNDLIDKGALALKVAEAAEAMGVKSKDVSGMDFDDFEGDIENFTD